MWAKNVLRIPGDVITLDDIAFNARGRDDADRDDEDDSGDDGDDDDGEENDGSDDDAPMV